MNESAQRLRVIEAAAAQLAKDAEDHPADPYDLWVLARQIGAQAEMLERGVSE